MPSHFLLRCRQGAHAYRDRWRIWPDTADRGAMGGGDESALVISIQDGKFNGGLIHVHPDIWMVYFIFDFLLFSFWCSHRCRTLLRCLEAGRKGRRFKERTPRNHLISGLTLSTNHFLHSNIYYSTQKEKTKREKEKKRDQACSAANLQLLQNTEVIGFQRLQNVFPPMWKKRSENKDTRRSKCANENGDTDPVSLSLA